MQYTLYPPKELNSTINLPASKSISNRALIMSALATPNLGLPPVSGQGNILPDNLSDCDDTEVMVAALSDLPYEINIKAAGTAMRFLTAYLAVNDGEHIITGTERMKHRPVGVLVDALKRLGADIEYVGEEGYPPLKIRGHQLTGGKLDIAGDVSSQYISALLMVGPVLRKGLTLHLTGKIISRTYIELTICTMREFGADVDWIDETTIKVAPVPYKKTSFFVENDWSAASYWYEIVALMDVKDGREVKLSGLMDGSRQGDSAVKYMFSMLGVKSKFAVKEKLVPTEVSLKAHRCMLPRFDFDFLNQPDLAQTLVVTTALMDIPFRFTGLQTLRIKETDRIAALKTEMAKLGYELDDSEEGSLSLSQSQSKGGALVESVLNAQKNPPVIDTYDDHRMALAFAPACIKFPGLKINNPEVVTKSYPDFWNDLRKAGFLIQNEN